MILRKGERCMKMKMTRIVLLLGALILLAVFAYREYAAQELRARGLHVETGQFGAMMEVSLVNDGPFTVLVEA